MELHTNPKIMALFHKRIEGDDALLELARRRFLEVGLGTEMPADSAAELGWLMGFRPSLEAPVMVHLARDLNLCRAEHRQFIAALATQFAGQVMGFVVHDQIEMVRAGEDYRKAVRDLDARLGTVEGAPTLFIEYAVGNDPELYARFFQSISELARIGPCLDMGHLGLWHVHRAFARRFPGEELGTMDSADPRLPRWMPEIDRATAAALPGVVELIGCLGPTERRVHFHLHDGHPLARLSPFGVSDHLSFYATIPLSFSFNGHWSLPPMFGPTGLANLVNAVFRTLDARRVSFTLEIHPVHDRLPLAGAAGLFHHWQDKTNAEKMNHWLTVLVQNHQLLGQAIRQALIRGSGSPAISD
jgi:hypothetical protein